MQTDTELLGTFLGGATVARRVRDLGNNAIGVKVGWIGGLISAFTFRLRWPGPVEAEP
jgi:hypothetical protein